MTRWLDSIDDSRDMNLNRPSEKAMAPHSSTLAWKIPWMEEPGRLQSMGLQRVGHDVATEQQHAMCQGREANILLVS